MASTLIDRIRCDVDRGITRVSSRSRVHHALMHFGPAYFAKVVGRPVCDTCAVAPDDAPLCEADMDAYFEAVFGDAVAPGETVVTCWAHTAN